MLCERIFCEKHGLIWVKNKMMLKQDRKEKGIERQIAIGMIVSDQFLSEIASLYNPNYMISPFAKNVTMWCLDYFNQYDQAPKEEIQQIFESKTEKLDPDVSDLIEIFLDSISDEYERGDKFNSEYVLDQATRYFKKRSIESLITNLYASLREGEEEEAEDLLTQYVKVDRITEEGINPFTDEEKIKEAFAEKLDPLFQYPGDLGRLINSDLCRGSFFAIMAPTKRGKTWWIWDMMLTAVKAKCNVAFFQAGDMTEEQQLRRIYISLAKRPIKESNARGVLIPVLDCLHNQNGTCARSERTCDSSGVLATDRLEDLVEFEDADPHYVPCTACKGKKGIYKPSIWYMKTDLPILTAEEAVRRGKRFQQTLGKRRLKLSTHPNKTLTVNKIRQILDAWEVHDGFIPDVIGVDYADIMAPSSHFKDFRHSQNDIWQDLRALSQERNCLVVTATQADAASYEAKSVRQKNFSEDRRKLDHVTSMIALNQTPFEKRRGLMRIGMLLARDAEFDIDREVYVLQNLTIGKPHLGSFFRYEIKGDNYEEDHEKNHEEEVKTRKTHHGKSAAKQKNR